MKSKQLYTLAKAILYPTLETLGFKTKNGKYTRILNSGVVHLIALAKDPHGAETFMLMCGVDATQLKSEIHPNFGFMKHDGLYHLTPKGWDYNSGRWPCETEEKAHASINALLSLILELAIPYFESITSLSDVANEINEVRMPGLVWMKARLYMLDGDIPRAREAIEHYAAWAAKPRNWGTKEHQREDMARAEQVRQEIEAAVSGKGD